MNKILHLNSNYADAFYKELFSSIKDRGFENVVFIPQKNNFDDCPDATGVIKSQCYSKIDRFLLSKKAKKIANSVEELVDLKDVNLIHAHSLYTSGVPAYYLYLKYNIPYVISIRYNDVTDFPKINFAYKGLVSRVIKNAKAIIFITPLIRKKAQKVFRVLKEESVVNKCYIVPNKVSKSFLNNPEPKDYNNKNLNVLFVGRFVPLKRIPLLCKHCSKLFKDGDKLTIITGSNDRPEKLLNNYKFINYVGRVKHDELAKYYREADIFALLSRNETFGISYIEAMSQGTPILYAKNQAIDGMFEQGSVGYAVKAKSSKDFINKVRLILKNYKTISSNCINEAKYFSDSEIVSKLISIYNK